MAPKIDYSLRTGSVTWDQTVVSRTAVRGERCRFAKRRTVSYCKSRAYDVSALHGTAQTCQNGMDSKLYAVGCTLPVDNWALSLVVCRHPGVDSTPPVIDSTPPVVDSRLHFGELPAFMSPLETSNRRPEASGRRLEVLFRGLQVHGCQLRVVNCEMCSLQSPSGDLQSSAETVQSITHLDLSRDRSARFARRTRYRTRRARAPPGRCRSNLGRGFSRPLLEARSMMAASNYHTRSNSNGAQNGKIPKKRS